MLGPSAAADILQLSNSLPLQSRGRTRLLVGNEDVHIIARSDDELLDDFFHEQSSTGGQAGKNHAPLRNTENVTELPSGGWALGIALSLTRTLTCDPSSPSGTLSSIPTALTRWTDECKVLDAESMHDCVAGKQIGGILGHNSLYIFILYVLYFIYSYLIYICMLRFTSYCLKSSFSFINNAHVL